MAAITRMLRTMFVLIGRVWKSGTWGKVGVSVVGLALVGAVMPKTPKAVPAQTTVSTAATTAPVRQVAALLGTSVPTSDDVAVARPTAVLPKSTARPTDIPATSTPQPTAIPPTPTPNRTLALGVAVNVRAGPNAAFDKVSTLNASETVTVFAVTRFQDVQWYQIKTGDGQTGWVSADVVTLDDALVASLPVNTKSFVLPTAVPEPTAKPAPPPAAAKPRLRYDPYGPDRDCGDFDTYAEAYAFFVAAGGPNRDPHRLDGDNDGIPCESLP